MKRKSIWIFSSVVSKTSQCTTVRNNLSVSYSVKPVDVHNSLLVSL